MSADWNNWITIKDRNEWATSAWNWTSTISKTSTFLWTYYGVSATVSSGYVIPTQSQWNNIINLWVSLWAWGAGAWKDMASMLRMPYYWYKNNGSYYSTTDWYYWTRTVYTGSAKYYLRLKDSEISTTNSSSSYELLVRALKSTSVVPDNTWSVLYPN